MGCEEENGLIFSDVNPKVAFFVEHLARSPKLYLVADRERGGLTQQGVESYTREIRQKVQPHLKSFQEDQTILERASRYQEARHQANPDGGTDGHSLFGEDRKEFLDFLVNNEVLDSEEDEFLLRAMSTTMVF